MKKSVGYLIPFMEQERKEMRAMSGNVDDDGDDDDVSSDLYVFC